MRNDAWVLGVLLTAIWASPVEAYIDPGTGSMAYQLLLSAFLGIGYAIRRWMTRGSQSQVIGRLKRLFSSRA